MLFAYSTNGLEFNWLNPTIIGVILDGLKKMENGNEPSAWPSCIPDAIKPKLNKQYGFRKKLNNIWVEYKKLTEDQKMIFKSAVEQQSNLPEVITGLSACTTLATLPAGMIDAVANLFSYMFDQLGRLMEGDECIRDRQFRAIYNALGDRLCPFCGLNNFRAPGAPRHALDHFMPIFKYPFAGADLRNLPPVCDECNSRFKGTIDVLYDNNGARRRCSNPYSGPTYQIRLSRSTLFSGNVANGFTLPRWQIDFVGGPTEQAESWSSIFKIRERYIRDVLDADFLSWITHFANWFVSQIGRNKSAEDVAAEIPRYIGGVIQDRLADRAFLKAEVFRLLENGCACPVNGYEVRQWLWGFVEYAV
jgi:hypothetical protein